jgi:hypothetical protein
LRFTWKIARRTACSQEPQRLALENRSGKADYTVLTLPLPSNTTIFTSPLTTNSRSALA